MHSDRAVTHSNVRAGIFHQTRDIISSSNSLRPPSDQIARRKVRATNARENFRRNSSGIRARNCCAFSITYLPWHTAHMALYTPCIRSCKPCRLSQRDVFMKKMSKTVFLLRNDSRMSRRNAFMKTGRNVVSGSTLACPGRTREKFP